MADSANLGVTVQKRHSLPKVPVEEERVEGGEGSALLREGVQGWRGSLPGAAAPGQRREGPGKVPVQVNGRFVLYLAFPAANISQSLGRERPAPCRDPPMSLCLRSPGTGAVGWKLCCELSPVPWTMRRHFHGTVGAHGEALHGKEQGRDRGIQ